MGGHPTMCGYAVGVMVMVMPTMGGHPTVALLNTPPSWYLAHAQVLPECAKGVKSEGRYHLQYIPANRFVSLTKAAMVRITG